MNKELEPEKEKREKRKGQLGDHYKYSIVINGIMQGAESDSNLLQEGDLVGEPLGQKQYLGPCVVLPAQGVLG